MDSNLKISILLPAYNAEKTLSKSIESVLRQSYTNFELIILNDGSIDKTEEIIKLFDDPRIVYIKNEKNIGLIQTLNKGFDLSSGELIARIDADDIWIDTDKLSKQITFLKNNPDCIIVGTQALLKKQNKLFQTKYPTKDISIRKKILSKNFFIHSSVLFKKDKVIGQPYKKEDYLLEDYSLWLQLGLIGKFANLNDYCVEYFINPIGETQKNNLLQSKNSLRLIKKYKNKYPNYFKGYLLWLIKIILRQLSFYLK